MITWSLSSLEHAMCDGVLPFSSAPNAQSLMFGSAPDLRSSSVISTPVSSGSATAMWRGAMPDCWKKKKYVMIVSLLIVYFNSLLLPWHSSSLERVCTCTFNFTAILHYKNKIWIYYKQNTTDRVCFIELFNKYFFFYNCC